MKQYTFVLNFGYVESASISYMPFTSLDKYKNAKEALIDLAKFLQEQYADKHKVKLKKCCSSAIMRQELLLFCSKCGTDLTINSFDNERFTEWLVDMSCANVDTFYGEFIDYDITYRWQSNGLEGALNQRFVYEAEWVLTAALGFPHNSDRTFEDVCKNRTKEKKNSFSYY